MNRALYFLLGVGVGAAGAYFYLKDKYEKYTQEEIESVKQAYKEKSGIANAEPEKEEEQEEAPTSVAERIIKNNGYTDYRTKYEREPDPAHKPFSEDPEIISEEDFGEMDEYEKVTLTLYADGVLADDITDEIVDRPEEKVGTDYLDRLTKDGEDAVFVRNDIEKTDYEIVKNLQTYKEVTGNDPSPETEE